MVPSLARNQFRPDSGEVCNRASSDVFYRPVNAARAVAALRLPTCRRADHHNKARSTVRTEGTPAQICCLIQQIEVRHDPDQIGGTFLEAAAPIAPCRSSHDPSTGNRVGVEEPQRRQDDVEQAPLNHHYCQCISAVLFPTATVRQHFGPC